MGNNESSESTEWNDQLWSRNIKTFFDSSKITDPLNFNADFLVRLSTLPHAKTLRKKQKLNNQEEVRKLKNCQSFVFAFVSREGEFTVLSNVLPEILYHVILGDTKITSVCLFYPSNTLIASAINRNSVIVATFNYLNDDNVSDSNSLNDSKLDFIEIKGIESPQLLHKVDNDSFIVSDSKSSIYILNMKKYFDHTNNLSSPYQKLIDSPQPSEPIYLAFFDGYVALSTSTGLLIGKIKPSNFNDQKINENESDANMQYVPSSLFYPDLANVHHLTFIKVNDINVLLFFITANNQAVDYVRIKDISNNHEDNDQKMIQLLISADDPVEIYSLSPFYIKNNKNEIFITDLIHPEVKAINPKDDDSSNKTIIFSCGREIFSFTLSSSFLSPTMPTSKPCSVFLNEKIQIPASIQVQVQNANINQDQNSDVQSDTKIYTCLNSIVKLLCTNEPRIFAALCTDGTVVICKHPPYSLQGSVKDAGSIESAILFNYHRCRPILACTADDFSFLTFDENHVAILWESFPDWWNAPFYLKMFADNEDEEQNEYDGEEDDAIEDH